MESQATGRRIRRHFQVCSALALLAGQAAAGTLDDFENKAGEPLAPRKESRRKERVQHDAFGSGTYPSESRGESFLESFWIWLVASPLSYRQDDPSGRLLSDSGEVVADAAGEWRGLHRTGAPVLPYLRADCHYQYIDSRLDAQDIRLEAGYKPLALHGRHTRYTERNPSDDLTLDQFYGVLRVGTSSMPDGVPIRGWELGIGGGVVRQQGNEEHSSGAFTMPIKIYPVDWFGVEFRPAWYRPQERTIGDYDLCARLGGRFFQLCGGYRWLWVQGQGHFLNGPYAGLSVSL